MRNIPVISFSFPFDGNDDLFDFDYIYSVRFDGSIYPIVNNKRLESKMDICRCAIHLLRQFGYVFGPSGKPTPPLYLHYKTQPYSDLTFSLFTVCSFVSLLPYHFDWSNVFFNGLRFVNDVEQDSYCVVALCSDVKGTYRCIRASSVCLIDSVVPVLREYLSYDIKDSYILISH